MRIRLMSDGRVLEGTAKQIVEAMQYIDWLTDQVERLEQTALRVEGETDEEKAASLVQAMLGAGLAEKV